MFKKNHSYENLNGQKWAKNWNKGDFSRLKGGNKYERNLKVELVTGSDTGV